MSSTTTPSKRTSPRLTIDDWVEVGFTLLAEEGLSAIKVDRLCGRMGVTKGSFYWHFEDLETYFETLADRWGEVRDSARAAFGSLEALPPQERLFEMVAVLASERQWTLERAVREWARGDAKVAARVHESDKWVRRAVTKAFRDAGFSPADSAVRANAMFYAGVGILHVADEHQLSRGAKQRRAIVEILLKR